MVDGIYHHFDTKKFCEKNQLIDHHLNFKIDEFNLLVFHKKILGKN